MNKEQNTTEYQALLNKTLVELEDIFKQTQMEFEAVQSAKRIKVAQILSLREIIAKEKGE